MGGAEGAEAPAVTYICPSTACPPQTVQSLWQCEAAGYRRREWTGGCRCTQVSGHCTSGCLPRPGRAEMEALTCSLTFLLMERPDKGHKISSKNMPWLADHTLGASISLGDNSIGYLEERILVNPVWVTLPELIFQVLLGSECNMTTRFKISLAVQNRNLRTETRNILINNIIREVVRNPLWLFLAVEMFEVVGT